MTTGLPFVSVVIPIYNGELDLPDLMGCLCSQTYPRDRVEYLLVDNNSGDRTHTLLQDYVQQVASQGMKVRSLSETAIQSSYAARNRGIKAARGEIIAFTDADCRPTKGWLEHLVSPFQQSSAVGIVAGEITGLPSTNWLEVLADRQQTLSQSHTLSHPFRPYGQTANLAVRHQLFQQFGLFRPYLTTGGDADLCWRILADGAWSIHFAPQAIVKHRHRSTLEALRQQWQRYGRSHRYLHCLHSIALAPELTTNDYIHRWGRWVLQEIPMTIAAMIKGKADWLDVWQTPVGLICHQARSHGQRQAKLPLEAETIEWLPETQR